MNEIKFQFKIFLLTVIVLARVWALLLAITPMRSNMSQESVDISENCITCKAFEFLVPKFKNPNLLCVCLQMPGHLLPAVSFENFLVNLAHSHPPLVD